MAVSGRIKERHTEKKYVSQRNPFKVLIRCYNIPYSFDAFDNVQIKLIPVVSITEINMFHVEALTEAE